MIAVDRVWMREIAASAVGALVVVAIVLLLLDGVERAGAGTGWWLDVIARWPGQIVGALPVACALAAARVTGAWARTGRLVALQAIGVSPARLAGLAALAGVLVAGLVAAGREAVAPWASARLAGQDEWTTVPVGDATLVVRAARLDGERAEQIVVARLESGRLAGRGTARTATWRDGAWSIEDGAAVVWRGDDAPTAATLELPPLPVWRAHAVAPGPDAPASRLWAESGSPRRVWLHERLLLPIACGAIAAWAVVVALIAPRWGVPVVLAGAVAWRLVEGNAVAAAARGVWSVGAATTAPLAVAVAAAAVAAWWAHRRVPADASAR